MSQADARRTPLGMLLSAAVLGALAWTSADTITLAVGLGVLLVVGLSVTTTVAGLAVTATGSTAPAARRLRRQWGRAPIPMLDPGLAGRPRPRAPGCLHPEVPLLAPH